MSYFLVDLAICHPVSSSRTQWQSSTDVCYPQEFGLAVPEFFWGQIYHGSSSPESIPSSHSAGGGTRDPVFAILQLDIFGITAPCLIDIYEGGPSRKDVDTRNAETEGSLYESSLFLFAHSEQIASVPSSTASNAAFHAMNQRSVEICFMLRPNTQYLRCLVYGASSSYNPYRICEILAPKLGVVTNNFELSFEDCMLYEHGMAVLLRSAFRETTSRTGALQMKAIELARTIDQELKLQQDMLIKSLRVYFDTLSSTKSGIFLKANQPFRVHFDRQLHLKCLLLSQHLTYIGTWLQSALVRIRIEIVKISMRWAEFVAEPTDIFGQGFIDSMQPLVAMLNKLEESMESLDYITDRMIGSIPGGHRDGSSNGECSISVYITSAPVLAQCHTCHVSRMFYPRVCCQNHKAFSDHIGVVEIWILDSFLISPELMTLREVVSEFYIRRCKECRPLYQRFTTSDNYEIASTDGLIRHQAHVWLRNEWTVSSTEIAASIKSLTNSIVSEQLKGTKNLNHMNEKIKTEVKSEDEFSWAVPEEHDENVVKTLSVLSLLPAPENSLAENLFIQIWGPDLLPSNWGYSDPTLYLCKCSYLMEWFVKSSKEIEQREKPFTFRYFLETHRFHNFILSLIGIDNATVLFEPIDVVDPKLHQSRCKVIESLMSMLARPYSVGLIDSTGVCICASVVASNALLLGEIDLFFKSMKLIKTLHRNDGLLKDSIRMHEVDYSSLVFSLVLCIVSAVVGAIRLNSDMIHSASAVMQNVRNMILKLVITPHIGIGLMSYVLTGIIQGCLRMCKSIHSVHNSPIPEAVPCCTLAAIIEVCSEAINDMISEPKDVVHFNTSVTTNAFMPCTFLSFDKIGSLVETLESVGHIPSIEDIRRKMIYKLNLSVEIINNFFNPPHPPPNGPASPVPLQPIVSDGCNTEAQGSTADEGEKMNEIIVLEKAEDSSCKRSPAFLSEAELDFELVSSDEVSEIEAEWSYVPPLPSVPPSARAPEPETLGYITQDAPISMEESNEQLEVTPQRVVELWEMEPDEVVEVQPEFYEYWLYERAKQDDHPAESEPSMANEPPVDENNVDTDLSAPPESAAANDSLVDVMVVSSDDDEDSQSSVMRSIALAKIMANRMEAERIQLKKKRLVEIQLRLEQDKERGLMEIEEKRMRDIIRSEKARRQLNLAETRIAKAREERIREYHLRLEEYERENMSAEEAWQRANEAWMVQQLAALKEKEKEKEKHQVKEIKSHSVEAVMKTSEDEKTSIDGVNKKTPHANDISLDVQHKPVSLEAKLPELVDTTPEKHNIASSAQLPDPNPKLNEVKAAINKDSESSGVQSKDQKEGGCVIS